MKLQHLNVFNIVTCALTLLSHIAVAVLIYIARDYFNLYPSLFGCLIGIAICILLIADILLFLGLNGNLKPLKIVSCIITSLFLIGGVAGSIIVGSVNKTIDQVTVNGVDKYETVSGVFVSYGDNVYESLDALKDKQIRVGVVTESTEGVTSIGLEKLEKLKINYGKIEYDSMNECIFALAADNCDVAIISSAYSAILTADAENNDFSEYLENMHDIETFEQQVKANVRVSNKNVSTEPFNVLLIGWSRTELGSKIGLADAIILASVNPKTYTVSLMSIPRDSYVPITCYGGKEDKINSGRSTSRECFINTVEQLIGEEIDFFVEADYEAIVNIVDTLGGIKITNPVSFELDGTWLPAGNYNATGWQALEFCRERHHMPNGDFDRQKHQKEVIQAIVNKLIKSRDVSLVLKCIDAAGSYLTTNLSLSQITDVFNLVINTKNYTGMKTANLLDFETTRMTGYASWHYSYSHHFPLWIYKLYQGSVKDNIDHMHDILGVNLNTSDQEYAFTFNSNEPYEREPFYKSHYDEKEVHEELPPMVAKLYKMTYLEALEWAQDHGVTLVVKTIEYGSKDYDEKREGDVISQSPRYGSLLSEYNTVEITVMGSVDESMIMPKLIGKHYSKAVKWADAKNFKLKVKFVDANDVEGYHEPWEIVDQSIEPMSNLENVETNKLEIEVINPVKLASVLGKSEKDLKDWIETSMLEEPEIEYIAKTEGDGYSESNYGKVVKYSCKDEDPNPNSKITFYILKKSFTIKVVSEDTEKGTVTPSDEAQYLEGKKITIKATAKKGYKFTKWDDGVTEREREITVTGDKTYTASFEAVPQHTITVVGGTGSGSYYEGEEVTIKATPETGKRFTQWNDGNKDKQRTITVGTGDATYTASFEDVPKHTITVSSNGNGSVSGTTTDYEGEEVTITATADSGYHFVSWNDGNTSASRKVTIGTSDATYTATFEADPIEDGGE